LTVLENVMELRTNENGLTEQQARGMLGAFLFRKDDVHKKVAVLSGGEKSRLALVKLLVNPPNFLLMDEPTTHLDISSIDALITALQGYEGTLLFVSHDVHFIRQIAKTVLHVHSGRLTPYAGDYGYYLEKSKAGNERAALTAGFTDGRPKQAEEKKPEKPKAAVRPSASELRKLKSEVAKLEQQIADLEARQASLTAELADPATYAQGAKVLQLNADLKSAAEALQTATAAWEQAALRLSEAEGV
ncbi:MAG: ATP-binding cassette domain-containing protein, partial [Verrucomicrobiota bacterium]